MDSLDIYRRAAAALEAGGRVALVTVTDVTGSTPAVVGAKMLVFEREQGTAGTVGGGPGEARIIADAAASLGSLQRRLFRFSLDDESADAVGVCGGQVEYLVEAFDETALPFFQTVRALVDQDEDGVVVSVMAPEGLPQKACLSSDDHPEMLSSVGPPPPGWRETVAAAGEARNREAPGIRVSAGDVMAFVEPLEARPKLILCGAGHLAYHIARYARSIGFRVVVYDERPEYAHRARFPEADVILAGEFTCLFDRIRVDDRSYVVIVTRGHACDQIVLEQSVYTRARYIGMVGSRHKTQLLMQRLTDKGVSQQLLDRVYAPIGLSIGAQTPEEIALSVVCELVKVRRLGDAAPAGHMKLVRREAHR